MIILSVHIRTAVLLRALYAVASPTIYALRDRSVFCRPIDTQYLLVNRSTCRNPSKDKKFLLMFNESSTRRGATRLRIAIM